MTCLGIVGACSKADEEAHYIEFLPTLDDTTYTGEKLRLKTCQSGITPWRKGKRPVSVAGGSECTTRSEDIS